jgi:L-histidine Nalpha-methyltransferase
MSPKPVEPRKRVLLDPDWASGSLVDDVRRGLGGRPRRLPPKWLYDDAGASLFDQITRLPEYYPTEAERSILAGCADELAATCDASTLVELGSGTSDKTRTLLDAFRSAARPHRPLRRFVPVDVSDGTLGDAASMLSTRYPGMAVEAVVGDFTLHLGHLPRGDRRMVVFLGSTIGNFYVEERGAFLGALADSLDPGEWLLLGTDLVKDADRILAAYNDAAGLTERFIRNSLDVLSRELGADVDQAAFSYVPLWDARMERVDMRLRAEEPCVVTIPGADLVVEFKTGEEICVEISTKFRLDGIRSELVDAGFSVTNTWTDTAGDFALTLARRS